MQTGPFLLPGRPLPDRHGLPIRCAHAPPWKSATDGDSAVPRFFDAFPMQRGDARPLDAVLSDDGRLRILFLWGRDCPNCDIAKAQMLQAPARFAVAGRGLAARQRLRRSARWRRASACTASRRSWSSAAREQARPHQPVAGRRCRSSPRSNARSLRARNAQSGLMAPFPTPGGALASGGRCPTATSSFHRLARHNGVRDGHAFARQADADKPTFDKRFWICGILVSIAAMLLDFARPWLAAAGRLRRAGGHRHHAQPGRCPALHAVHARRAPADRFRADLAVPQRASTPGGRRSARDCASARRSRSCRRFPAT